MIHSVVLDNRAAFPILEICVTPDTRIDRFRGQILAGLPHYPFFHRIEGRNRFFAVYVLGEDNIDAVRNRIPNYVE